MTELQRPSRIKVDMTLIPTSSGGRRGPIASGYRPTFRFRTDLLDGIVDLEGRTEAFPGESFLASVRIVRPDLLDVQLAAGLSFEATEGLRVVATGRILSVEDNTD